MTGRLQGKVALVTGAGSVGPGWGNGKAIATLFAREGATIVGCDRSLAAAEETGEIIRSEGNMAVMHQADVTDPAAITTMIDATLAQFGRIDVLINNVGIVAVGGAIEFSLEEWRKVLDVNLTSMFLMCKAVLPTMKQQGAGSIVNIGSIAGIRYTGVPYISYAATKSGVLGLSRSVALQHARDGIRSNVVMPGLMKTPFVVEPLKDIYGKGNVDDMMRVRDEQCPMGHMGDAWDVAYASLFLASDEAKYVTAAELVVDGGITAKFS